MKINEVLIIAVGFIVMSGNTFADQSMRYHSSMIGVYLFTLAIIMMVVRAVKKLNYFSNKDKENKTK